MKVLIEQATLLKALDHLRGVVERKKTIPILGDVLMNASADKLTLRATDLDIEITETVACAVEQVGGITASAFTLYDLVRKMPAGGQIKMESTSIGDGLHISCGRIKSRLPTQDPADFPSMVAGENHVGFEIAASALVHIISSVRIAMSTEETRYYLNGFYTHHKNGNLVAVATDGHRLVRVTVPAPEGSEDMPGVIVPRKTAGQILSLLDGFDGDVSVSVNDTKIAVTIGDLYLVSKLIDGTFPDYERVIPTKNEHVLTGSVADVRSAVDRIATVVNQGAVGFTLKSGEPMTLFGRNADAGNVSEEVDVEYSGGAVEIGFNRRYVGELFSQFTGQTFKAEVDNHLSPVVFLDPNDEAVTYILMPMRV